MKQLKILFLEDSEYDAEMTGHVLKKAGINFNLKLVDTQNEYLRALNEYTPDLILADHSLFQFNSTEALKLFHKTGMKIPFILVTGTVSEEFAVSILKEGADDYLLKSNLARLPNAIMSSLEKYRLEEEKQEYINHLIANEALLREAEELTLSGSWEADTATGEMKWSDGIFRIFGYEPRSISAGQDIIMHHIHPDDRAGYRRGLYSILPDKDRYTDTVRCIDKSGKEKFVSLTIGAKRSETGRLIRLVGFMQDVTEKTELEKELAMQAVYQKNLTTEVAIQAQEKERNEIGLELHDNINQILATVTLYLRTAMETADPDKKKLVIEKGMENTVFAIEEIRRLSKSLVAPSLGDLGLLNALHDLAEDISGTGILAMTIESDIDSDKRFDKSLELMLYRVVQEQINNIRKYANAHNVVISVKEQENNVILTVSDDGSGFDPSKKAKGIGLRNIRSRVEYYSGDMKIISSPGKGCTLQVSIPLKNVG